MAGLAPFAPTGATVNLSATNTTGRVQFNTARSDSVRLYNAGSEAVFVQFGDATVVATTAAGMPIPAATAHIFSCNGQSYVAGITAGAGPAVLYATPGEGL